MQIKNLDATHLGKTWTIKTPHFPEVVVGELHRIEHFKPSKSSLSYIVELIDEESEKRYRDVRTVKTEYATSLMLGDYSFTAPSDTIITPFTYEFGD